VKRWLIILLLLLLLAGGAVFCTLKWDAWFGNPPEHAYSVPTQPHNICLSFGATAASDRTVSWRADTVLSDSYLYLASRTDTFVFPAEGQLIASRAGKAAFYSVALTHLTPGQYAYSLQSGSERTRWYSFSIGELDDFSALLFGDIQDANGQFSRSLFAGASRAVPHADFFCQLGDFIERPEDVYWQVAFRSMNGLQTRLPMLSVPGNHEYLKGLCKTLDARWMAVHPVPLNGPERFLGQTYYVDFPRARFIMIDTDALQRLSDYTVTAAWLRKVLQSAEQDWKIVLMHHPVFSSAEGRQNPVMFLSFIGALEGADVVLAGHDHSYARRISGIDHNEVPVFINLVSSDKQYLPSLSKHADRVCSGHAMYEHIRLQADTLFLDTYLAANDSLYDRVKITREKTYKLARDRFVGSDELIDLPARYAGQSSKKIDRFYEKRAKRLSTK